MADMSMDDSQSVAPSMNPSHRDGPLADRNKMQKAINVDINGSLKDISATQVLDMADNRIYGKYPLGDKLKLKLNCFKNKEGCIKQIMEKKALLKFDEMFPEIHNAGYGMKLSVKGTGILEMDQYVLHPFVRVHIIDLNTNKYLAKSDRD